MDPRNMVAAMDYDQDVDIHVQDDEMDLKATKLEPLSLFTFSTQPPTDISEHRSTKRKSFNCDHAAKKSSTHEQSAENACRRIVHAKRTSAHNRDGILTKDRKSETSQSMMSADSALWTMTNTSDIPTENLNPEHDKSATCSPDSINLRTPISAGPNTMLDQDVTTQPQISANATPELIPHAMNREVSEAEEIHRMERVQAHIPTLDLGELAKKLQNLQLQTKRSSKRRAQKQKEQEVWQTVDHILENLSTEDLAELFTVQDDDGDNLLMIAIIEGCTILAKSLIRLVPSPDLLDIRNKLGQTALHLSVITHEWRMIRKLVLAGANLQSRDFIGNTPLHVACSNNDLDSVLTLTKTVTCHECPENAVRERLAVPQASELYNYRGQTCLHIAAQNGFTYLVRYLVETRFRADINAPERLSGKTALHIAAELGNLNLVEYLLSKDGTNPDALTYAGHSALDLAEGRGQESVCKVLERAGITAQATQQSTPEEEEQDEREEEERNLLTLQDFQCSVAAGHTQQVQLQYDDLCVGGTPLQSLQR